MIEGDGYLIDLARKYYEHGWTEGRKEGARAMLLRLLSARFGELPATVVAWIEGAEVVVLERWGDRVLTANTLAEVLDEPSESARQGTEASTRSNVFAEGVLEERLVATYRKRGWTECERPIFLRMLRCRFGALPPDAFNRVVRARLDVLARMGDRFLTAKSLAEVLDEPS